MEPPRGPRGALAMNAKHGCAAACALLLGYLNAAAVPVVYTDKAAWRAALGKAPVVAADPAGVAGELGLVTDLGEFTLVVEGQARGNGTVPPLFPRIDPPGPLELFIVAAENSFVRFEDFDRGGLLGFAADWTTTLTGDLLRLFVNGLTIEFEDYFARPGDGFLGIVDAAAPVTTLRLGVANLTSNGEYFTLSDIQIAAIPEPGTLSLSVAAIFALGAVSRLNATRIRQPGDRNRA